jgi:DNA-binding NarL/FixJ family response regulator
MSTNAVTVIVVGNLAIRTALRAILETDGRIQVIDEAGDGDQALRAYGAHPARVIVVSRLGAEQDHLETARRIREEVADARLIVMGSRSTFSGDEPDSGAPMRAMRPEAAGCLPGVVVELARR